MHLTCQGFTSYARNQTGMVIVCCCNCTNQLAYAHVRLLEFLRVISQTPYFRKVGDRRGEEKGKGSGR